MLVTPQLKTWLSNNCGVAATATDAEFKKAAGDAFANHTLTPELYGELSRPERTKMTIQSPDPTKVFGGNIRVKSATEAYCEKRAIGLHRKSGTPVFDGVNGRDALTMSQGAAARHGAFLKHTARKAGVLADGASDHEKALLGESVLNGAWAGELAGEYVSYLHDGPRVKALLDDAISGGISITPIEFDSDVLTFPLLTGEVYPHIDVKEVPRGRRIESGSMGTPVLSWGQADGIEVPLFNTASLVAPLDTTIFEVSVAIEIGNDFLSDSPANVGATLTQLIGERLAQELDRVTVSGNGGTEPEGFLNAAGVAILNSENGGGGPPTLSDYMSLHFALAKQYRTAASRVAFISNDTSYARSRQIKVDANAPSTDQRPVINPVNDVANYQTLALPHRIQNDIPNRTTAIIALSKYRMYRRLGLTLQWSREGAYLMRRNYSLLVARARFGGRLRDTNAAAKWTDGQA